MSLWQAMYDRSEWLLETGGRWLLEDGTYFWLLEA